MDSGISKHLEDGEIESGEDEEVYVPLARPEVVARVAPNVENSEPEDNEPSSSSDSNSDTDIRKTKRLKMRRKPPMKEPFKGQKKVNNIWCSSVQEDILSNNLTKCDVKRTGWREREVESYNYYYKRKATAVDFKFVDIKARLGQRKRYHNGKRSNSNTPVEIPSKEKKEVNSLPRMILPLTTSVNDSPEDIAKDIANKLLEEKEELIQRVIDILGKETAIMLFQETLETEKAGGLLVMNGTRRRTPGGVFFYLLRSSDDIPRDKITEVFAEDKKITVQKTREKAKENRKQNAMKLQKLLEDDDFPTLLTRTQQAIKELKERKEEELYEEETEEDSPQEEEEEGRGGEEEVKNPPPSPATDGRENSDLDEQRINEEQPSLKITANDFDIDMV